MPNFSIKEQDSKTVAEVTFNKATDYKAVKLASGQTVLIHKIQADDLIKAKKATEVKEVEVEETVNERTKVKVSK